MTDETLRGDLHRVLSDPALFSALGGIRLRGYQLGPLRAIIRAVLSGTGGRFAVLFPRQSGKNEIQAQLEAYLMTLFSAEGGDIVKISPTFRPQSLNAARRLERTLERHPLTRGRWRRRGSALMQLGRASATFLSGAPGANIVGATASLLLEVDEAQDIARDKFDRDIAPMAAARNAAIVFWGTAWRSDTLLAREIAVLKSAAEVPARRAFVLTADDVAREVPAYGEFVGEQIRRFGRYHPMIRTQFFSETIDSQLGLFGEQVISALIGTHDYAVDPEADVRGRYFFLIDFAGSSETACGGGTDGDFDRRDRSALTIVRTEPRGETDTEAVWLVQRRFVWLNRPLSDQVADLTALIRLWEPVRVVADATGVGAGPTSALIKAFGSDRIRPFIFTAASKSRLGWDFLALLERGRWLEGTAALPGDEDQLVYRETFFAQLRATQGEVSAGPEKRLRWGVPDAKLHDDLVMSAALATVVDGDFWHGEAVGDYGYAPDPLIELDRGDS